VTLELDKNLGRLPMNCETAIFRMVQASLTNIQLHSGSQTALIRLHKSAEGIRLMIKDEGKGISPEKLAHLAGSTGAHGLGLRGMRERVEDLGGRFEITSSHKGTEIAVVIPVPASRAASV
jgi:two-component system NarL family sensor kinase